MAMQLLASIFLLFLTGSMAETFVSSSSSFSRLNVNGEVGDAKILPQPRTIPVGNGCTYWGVVIMCQPVTAAPSGAAVTTTTATTTTTTGTGLPTTCPAVCPTLCTPRCVAPTINCRCTPPQCFPTCSST